MFAVSDLPLLLAAGAMSLRSVVWLVLVIRARQVDLPAVARALRPTAPAIGRRTEEEPPVSPG